MVFSSVSFLFFFLSLLFLVYFIVPKKLRNFVLLVFSLSFYFFGEKWYVILLILSCFCNYIFGILIDRRCYKKLFLIFGLLFNLGLLIYFKYTNFFIDTFNSIFNLNISTLKIVLPLGISFFTFQNISYLVDVYRKEVKSQKNFLMYATYITLFPQLVAGPIVRYKDVCTELKNRKENFEIFANGVRRFVIGLSKKVLIADTFYNILSSVMKLEMTFLSYWLVALCFTFQIYYDFSGYSDMAIGLGKMFGFNFNENFNYPLISSSVTEFWRRWHISLSSFFKDYVYIPLGGNRTSFFKTIRNIFVVWALTGLWHGSSWNFVLWGLYFFMFLIIEKFFLKKYLKNGIFSYIYTFLVIVISFVIFSITDLSELILFLKGMFCVDVKFINFESLYYLKISLSVIFIAFLGMGPCIKEKINNLKKGKLNKLINSVEVIWVMFLFIISLASIISSSFNPFIYFRF